MPEHRPPLSSSTKTVLITCGVLFLVGMASVVALFIVCMNNLDFR